MYYYSKNIVFIFEDREVRDEVDRLLNKDDVEFYHYISDLVEKDISKKLGKKVYEESKVIETDVKDLVKQDKDDQLSLIMNKLDLFMANFMANGSNAQNMQQNFNNFQGNNPIANSNNFVEPSIQSGYNQQTNHNQNESLAIDVTSQEIKKEVPVKEIDKGVQKPKAKKKKSIGLKGKDANSILSKMKSMQK